MEKLCPNCGRGLEKLGKYQDYLHMIPGTDYVCLERSLLPDDMKEIVNAYLDNYVLRLNDNYVQHLVDECERNEHGELPGDICCQRATSGVCYEHR